MRRPFTIIENAAAMIRSLQKQGYTQRQASIITKANKDFVSRVWRNLSFQRIQPEHYQKYDKWDKNKMVLDKVLKAVEIPGSGSLGNSDKAYIRLLKYCGVDYEAVKAIYSDRPSHEIRNIWSLGTDIKLEWFDPYILDIEQEDYFNFISP
jgi:hypothetical protein